MVHVFVALADNQRQGIIPVPAKLGIGRDPAHNLYWGAAYGVKTFFRANADWETLSCGPGPKATILERCVFKRRDSETYLVADAYDGWMIREAVTDYFTAAAGLDREDLVVTTREGVLSVAAGGASDVLVYVGHDAFMDFQIPSIAGRERALVRQSSSRAPARPTSRHIVAQVVQSLSCGRLA